MTKEQILDYSFLTLLLDEPLYVVNENKIHIPYIGENKRNITILLHHPQGDLLKTKEFELLLKVLHAAKLTQHEVAIVNWANVVGKATFDDIRHCLSPFKILAFGYHFDQLIFQKSFPLYQVHALEGCDIVFADSLTSILAEDPSQRTKAKALWAAMQQLFK
ncbi:MAG: hypothetical protein OHK0038_21800 [Flammeovirgaceae bacterium]